MAAITDQALIKRINRKLAGIDEQLRKARSYDHNLGWFYTVNTYRNWIVDTHVDLEELGRELGVLRPGEEVDDAL